jgi:hypothetical protein
MITRLKQPESKRPSFSVTTAGPRQAKQAEQALSALLRTGKGTVVLSNYGETVQYMLCSETPDEAQHRLLREAAYCRIHEKHGGTISKENFKTIIADCEAEIPALLAAQPRQDERKSDEQVSAERQAQDEEEARRRAALVIKDTKDREEAEALKAQYAHLTQRTTEISGHALAAQNIRTELKAAFPLIKFSVRTSTFAGGNDCRVEWTEGPTAKEVEKITDKYSLGQFDGMEDIYRYSAGVFNNLFGGIKYLFSEREIPQSRKDSILAILDPICGESFGAAGSWERKQNMDRIIYQALAATDLTGKGATTGVELSGSNWELKF